jgi:uridylate kinase
MAEHMTAAAHPTAATVPSQSPRPVTETGAPTGPEVGTEADGYPVTAEVQSDGRRPSGAPARQRLTRVLLKLGGEMFGGGGVGIDPDVVSAVARQIAEVVRSGVQVAVVIGGGNFFRGAQLQQRGMDRSRGDYMGMLGTVMNCLALQDFLEKVGVDTRVQTAITMGQIAEPYIPRRAMRHLEKGRVVIFGAGAGMPYFSTDTVAAQRALETRSDAVLMSKNGVDGVYSADPRTDPTAQLLETVTYEFALRSGLRVVDAAAFSLCMENKLPMVVFGMEGEGNVTRALRGEKIGTLVTAD